MQSLDTQAEAKRKSKSGPARPAVPALVPTAETTADDEVVDDIIEGEGEDTNCAVICSHSSEWPCGCRDGKRQTDAQK